MKEAVLETGKSILSFANMVTTVIFLKQFWEEYDHISLITGSIFWLTFYMVAILLIIRSKKIRSD